MSKRVKLVHGVGINDAAYSVVVTEWVRGNRISCGGASTTTLGRRCLRGATVRPYT